MAFTAKKLSWRFRHLNIVGCLLKRRGSGAPPDPPPPRPPSYAPAPVVEKVDMSAEQFSIQWIAQLLSLVLIVQCMDTDLSSEVLLFID